LPTFEYRCLQRGQFIRIIRPLDDQTRSAIAIPINGESGFSMGLIYADTRSGDRVLGLADMDMMTAIASLAAAQIESLVNGHTALRDNLADAQLTLLREVQAWLDPVNVPIWPQLQIVAHAKPGVKHGGDVYDISRLPNGLASTLIARAVADPMRAALAITEIRTAFRTACLHADPPHIQLQSLNWLLHHDKNTCRLDCAIVIFNPKTGTAEYSTAGDIGAMVVDQTGKPRLWTDLDAPSVGTKMNIGYARHTDRLRDGETLALFTPGCANAQNSKGENLGRNRLVETICDGFGQPASTALEGLLADLSPFFKDSSSPDDITLLLVHRGDPVALA